MLVSTIAITAIVAAAVIAWRFVSSEDDGPVGARGEWDEIALIDRSTGAITRVDADGEVVGRDVGRGRVNDVHVHGDRLALVGMDQIVLTGPDAEPITVPIERNSTVIPIRAGDRFHLAVGRPSGGNVLIVDADDGTMLDVGALAQQSSPLLFVDTLRWAADGSAFAVADAANFQTIVVRPGVEEAIFLPDQPVAVTGDLVATSQTVGRQADIALLDFDRKNQAFVPTEIPAGGIFTDDRLVMVSVDGGVYRVEKGAEEAERLGTVAVPSGARVGAVEPTADGERLVVHGQTFETIVDLDGTTVFTTTFPSALAILSPEPGWSCLPVGGESAGHSLVDVDDGEQLADLTGSSVLGTSSDGCAVLVERNGTFELIESEGSVALGSGREAVVGPDGRTVVRIAADGRVELIAIDDELELAEPLEIGAAGSFNTSVAFLDR